jgi:hypothetical protein
MDSQESRDEVGDGDETASTFVGRASRWHASILRPFLEAASQIRLSHLM